MITTDLQLAIEDLNLGKPVAIPTETVYGLAALIDNEAGIRAVFSLKNRPLNHPLIVHVASDWDLSEWVALIPPYAKTLMEQFWPGPLTLVFRAKVGRLNPLITGGQDTVALRSPKHPLAQALLHQLNKPLVAPSANLFCKISPTTAEHVQQSFPHYPLKILNGGRCKVGIESTIVDVTREEGYLVLRHGVISEQDLLKVSPELLNESTDNSIRVPGKLASHYQPEKPLYYFIDEESLARFCEKNSSEVFVIANKKPSSVVQEHFLCFPDSPEQAAFELYHQLRQADLSDASLIAIKRPPGTDAWAGVNERIIKAGTHYSIE